MPLKPRHLPLLIILCFKAQIAFSQGIDLSPAQRIRIADSLRVLPLVRQEANAWRTAYMQCDSASQTKSSASASLAQAYRACLDAEQARSTQAAANADLAKLWERKAKARGWKLAGLLALFAGYVVIRR